MSLIQRATLPAEFFDITTKMLLRQPLPQFLHARLIMGAMQAELDPTSAGLGLPIPGRQFGELGPNYAVLEDHIAVISDPIYKDAVKVVVEEGAFKTGHTVRINRPKYALSTYTRAARAVPAGSTISVTPINVQSEQVPLTIERYAGPHDGSTVVPYGVDRFDANFSIHNIKSVQGLFLQEDFHRTLDSFGVELFNTVDATTGVIRPDGMSLDDDALTVGSFPMSYAVCTEVVRSLTDANIQPFSNNNFLMILRPRQAQQLKRDPEFQRMARYDQSKNPIFVGSYVGSIDQLDILQSTTLSTATNSSSVAIQIGQAFGPGMVGLGMGNKEEDMPHVAYNTQDNYGQTSLVIWLWNAALGVLDSRFGRTIRTA